MKRDKYHYWTPYRKLSETEFVDRFKWCCENLGTVFLTWNYTYDTMLNGYSWCFQNEDDFVSFQLVWAH